MAKKSRRTATARIPVVFVGFGRMGSALARRLHAKRWQVSVLGRSTESVRRIVDAGIPLADHESLAKAKLCVLAVSDSAIPKAAALVERDLGATTALVHLSGALSIDAFGTRLARPRGSFHPLVAISDGGDGVRGHAVAIDANDDALREFLKRMANALELIPLEVDRAARPAYHAGAVLSSGLVVALLDAAASALQLAGIERERAVAALVPLMKSAIRGVEKRGLERSLTGPVARGDVDVVHAHLDALPKELGAVYRLLSQRALRLAPSLPNETRQALERLLA